MSRLPTSPHVVPHDTLRTTPGSTRRQWPTLAALYLERSRRALITMLLLSGPLALFVAHNDGFRPQDIAVNLLVVAILLPIGLGGVVGKCKADGSLAFLANLPVSRDEHARSWLAPIALLSLPLAILTAVAGYHGPLALRGIQLVAISLGAPVLTTTIAMVLVAVQLGAPPTMAPVLFLRGISIGLLSLWAGGELASQFPTPTSALLRSPLLVPALSVAMWGSAAGALWWSWRRIGHHMTSYVGDPPGA